MRSKKLDELTKPGRFSRLLNGLSHKSSDRAISKLKSHVENWYVHDKEVYLQLRILQETLNTELDEIDDVLRGRGQSEASAELQSFLKESEKRFNRIKELHAKLVKVSKEL